MQPLDLPVKTLDLAIDDYLHTIIRTRPWSKKREEELLEAFGDWLYEQPGRDTALEAITPALVAEYAAATGRSAAEHEALLVTLSHLATWAIDRQLLTANPFESSVASRR